MNPHPEPDWSAGHRGLCLYVARLLSPVWEVRLLAATGVDIPGLPQQQQQQGGGGGAVLQGPGGLGGQPLGARGLGGGGGGPAHIPRAALEVRGVLALRWLRALRFALPTRKAACAL